MKAFDVGYSRFRLASAATVLFPLVWLAAAQVAPPTGRDVAEREAAGRARATFGQIERDHRDGRRDARTYRLAESDLNALIAEELTQQPNPVVEKLVVKLRGQNVFATSIRVNLDEVRLGNGSMATALMGALLRGRHDLEVEGLLETSEGKGTYQVRSANLDGLPIPVSVVEAIFRAAGARLDPPFDPTAPFDLDHGVRRVQIDPGLAVIHAAG